jgi:ElaB/YqjD/DUF883 family membrane-anchored ribosome-binding protein
LILAEALNAKRDFEQELQMAKPVPKDDKKKSSKAVSGIVGKMPLLGFLLGIIGAVLLALAAVDFRLIDFRPVFHGFEPVFVVLLFAGATLCFFGAARVSAQRHKIHPDSFATFRSELETMLSAQKAAADDAASAHRTQTAASLKDIAQKVDAFIGGEHARLKEENDRLRSHVEGLQRQEADKAAGEIDALRQKNAELEERITQWAVGSIDSRIERKTLQAA